MAGEAETAGLGIIDEAGPNGVAGLDAGIGALPISGFMRRSSAEEECVANGEGGTEEDAAAFGTETEDDDALSIANVVDVCVCDIYGTEGAGSVNFGVDAKGWPGFGMP
jgi:hypothetical protein